MEQELSGVLNNQRRETIWNAWTLSLPFPLEEYVFLLMLSLGQQSLAENKSLKEDIRDTDYLCKFWKDNDKPQVWKGFNIPHN